MEFQFYLPVRVVAGPQAVRRCGPRFAALGKKCLIVTGRHAAAACGALGDVTDAFIPLATLAIVLVIGKTMEIKRRKKGERADP